MLYGFNVTCFGSHKRSQNTKENILCSQSHYIITHHPCLCGKRTIFFLEFIVIGFSQSYDISELEI